MRRKNATLLMIHSLSAQLVTESETLGQVKNMNFDGKRQILWRRLYISLASALSERCLLNRTILVSTSLMGLTVLGNDRMQRISDLGLRPDAAGSLSKGYCYLVQTKFPF